MSKKILRDLFVVILCLFIFCSLPPCLNYLLRTISPHRFGFLEVKANNLEITYKEILFFTSVVLCLFLISTGLKFMKNSYLKRMFIFIPLVYLAAACVFIVTDVLYYLVFDYHLTFSIIQTILNSNAEETKAFFHLYISPKTISVLLLFFTGLFFLCFKWRWFADLLCSTSFFVLSLSISLFGLADFIILGFSEQGNLFLNVRYWDITVGEYKHHHEFMQKMRSEKNVLALNKNYDQFYNQDTLNKTLVLIISESINKQHMSLYGYERKTTPFLDNRRDLYVFKDCVASAVLTVDAVPALFFNEDDTKDLNLIPLLNKLGYETVWISNQSGWGKKDAPIVLLSELCSKSVFKQGLAENDESNSNSHYDDELISDFEKVLKEPSKKSKFIVLHLMGCHFDYEKRYPEGRGHYETKPPSKWADTERKIRLINSYDNAVSYHDSVVNRLLTIFSTYSETKNKTASLLFLSDHGEEVFDNRDFIGHSYPPSKLMSEIPFFVYLSRSFKKNYAGEAEIIQQRVNTAYSVQNNFYTLLHLLNIYSKKEADHLEKKAFFSANYDSTCPRYVMGKNYGAM